MAGYTITSNGTVATAKITWGITGTHATKMNLFINYTKGDESSTVISCACAKDILPSVEYKAAIKGTLTVAQHQYTLSASGAWSLSVELDGAADDFIVNVAAGGGSPTGTVDIKAYPVVE